MGTRRTPPGEVELIREDRFENLHIPLMIKGECGVIQEKFAKTQFFDPFHLFDDVRHASFHDVAEEGRLTAEIALGDAGPGKLNHGFWKTLHRWIAINRGIKLVVRGKSEVVIMGEER